MAGGLERRIVKAVQKALAAGPMSQDDLMAALQQAGVRAELGDLFMACKIHGLADFDGDRWVPRGWAAPVEERTTADQGFSARSRTAVPAPRRPVEITGSRWTAQVRRLASSIGVPMVEPVPPVGPVPDGWAETAGRAARALSDELRAVTARRNLHDVPLSAGSEAATAGRRRLVRFEAEGELGVSEGMPATLIIDNAPFDVEVVSVFGNVVTLSMPSDAPVARDAVLRCDLSWLLSCQSQRLRELMHGGPGFNAVAAMAVVSTAQPPTPPADLPAVRVAHLNRGQRHAVRLALTPGTTWLWGPPGTGKTTTLAALVAQLYRRGQRVLLTAPTNAALDVAIKASLKRLPELARGALVRLGQPVDPALIEYTGGHILIDEIAAVRGAPIAKWRVEEGRKLRELRERLEPLKRRHGQLSAEDQSLRLALEKEIAERTDLVRELDRSLQQVRRQVCREAAIVAATSHQVVLQTLKELTFDVVILDEASMTTAALAMLVAGSGTGHTIVAGDFRQLPPVAVAETPAAQEWLHQSPFEKAGIDTAVGSRRPPARLAALTEQYRMRDSINEVVSTAFYPESPLVTAPAIADRPRRSQAPWASGELVVLDTSSLGAATARRQGVSSRYNLMHAQLVAALLGPEVTGAQEIGLVTPFAAQARLLESLLPETVQEAWAASTVHRFQGGERDIIIYDTVDTGRGVTPLHRWFTDGESGSQGARLLNVAASRARDHLVVVGAVNRLHKPRERDAVWTFFAHLLDQAEHLPWEKALTFSSATEQVTSGLVERLRDDLARATAVEMWLPWAPLVGLRALIPYLQQITDRQSETEPVTVWVEPDPDGYLSAEALEAKRAGINIRPCTPILESGAVIGDVVWSSIGTLLGPAPGTVLRTENRAFADAVRRAQRRRPGPAPGSGQLAEDCGRCSRTMVRFELSRRGEPYISYGCVVCDRQDSGGTSGRDRRRYGVRGR